MKTGCLVLLLAWAGAAAGEWWWLQGTLLAPRWWLALALGLTVASVVGCLLGLWLSGARARSLRRPPKDWRDGDFVGLAGRLQVAGEPLLAPGSAQRCALYLYALRRPVQRGQSVRQRVDGLLGMGLAQLELRNTQGSWKLAGFPLLAEVPERQFADRAALERLALVLLQAQPPPQPHDNDPLARFHWFKEMNWMPRQEHFYDPQAGLDLGPALALQQRGEHAAAQRQLHDLFGANGWTLHERSVPVQAEFCAFGYWREGVRTIAIDGGFDHPGHDLVPGTAAQVSTRALRRSLTWLLVWLAVAVAAHAAAWHFGGRPGFGTELPAERVPQAGT